MTKTNHHAPFHLNHYFLQAWPLSLATGLWLLIGATLNTAYGVTMGRALTALGHRQLTNFGWWLIITAAVLAGYAGQRYFEPVVEMHTNEHMALRIRRDLLARLGGTSSAQFHAHPVPDYTSWLTNDIGTISDYGFENTWMALGQCFNVLLGGATLFYYHWSLLVAVVLLTGLMLAVPRLFTVKMNAANAAVAHANEAFTTAATDLLNGYDQLNLLNQTQQLVAGTHAQRHQVQARRIAYARASSRFYAVNNAVSFFCQMVVLALTGYLYFQGRIPLGVFSTAEILAGSFFASLTGLTENWAERATAQPLLDKFAAVPQEPRTQGAALAPLQDALVLQDVSFQYPGAAPVLQDLNYRFTAGGRYAVVGASGVGKSTLLSLLAGKLTPSAGTLTYDGQPLAGVAPRAWHAQVAVVDQHPILFNRSLAFNLTLGAPIPAATIAQATAAVGLTPLIAQLPAGLDSTIDYASANLSGGQRQRIALARALLAGRSVLLLDEVTASLDPASARTIEQVVLTWPAVTVIAVTHHLSAAMAAQVDGILTLTAPAPTRA